jgi:tyrosine-protein phosphatase SIW14
MRCRWLVVARSLTAGTSRSVFSLKTRAGLVGSHGPDQIPRLGPSGASTSPESGLEVSTDENFLSRKKTQTVVDIFVPRLFVVVFLPLNLRACNAFGLVVSRATLFASKLLMKRAAPVLILSFLLSHPLFAQTNANASAAPVMQSAYGQKLHIAGVHNAGKITDVLYRGAQPKEQGLSELKKLGINTIVDLRGENPEKAEWERKLAESLGMRFIHIPVSGWSPPTNEQVLQFLSIFRDDPAQKVFVHCRFGDDRTGVFVATYRMALEKWPAEQALKEMYFFGFNGFWHPAMKSFIRDFPERLNSAPALSPLHAGASRP